MFNGMRTIKLSAMLGVVLLGVSACGGGSGNEEAAASDQLPVMNEGTLTICISKNAYPPLYWKEGGELTGFDVDSAGAIADELGLDIGFSEVAFDGLMPALTSGRCDMMRSGLYINEERSSQTDPIPYLKTGPALITTTETAPSLTGVEDLSGMSVAVQAASANEKQLTEASEQLEADGKEPIDISRYPELPETVAALENGRADATMETDVAAIEVARSLGDGYETVDTIFEADTDFGMFLQPDSPLTEHVEQAASDLTEDGTFAEFAREYGLSEDRLVAPGSE